MTRKACLLLLIMVCSIGVHASLDTEIPKPGTTPETIPVPDAETVDVSQVAGERTITITEGVQATITDRRGTFRFGTGTRNLLLRDGTLVLTEVELAEGRITDSSGRQRVISGSIASFENNVIVSQPERSIRVDGIEYSSTGQQGFSFNIETNVLDSNLQRVSLVDRTRPFNLEGTYIGSVTGRARIEPDGPSQRVVLIAASMSGERSEPSRFDLPGQGTQDAGFVQGVDVVICRNSCPSETRNKIEYTAQRVGNSVTAHIRDTSVVLQVNDGYFDIAVRRIDGSGTVQLRLVKEDGSTAFMHFSRGLPRYQENMAGFDSVVLHVARDGSGLDRVFGYSDGNIVFDGRTVGDVRRELRDMGRNPEVRIATDVLEQLLDSTVAGTHILQASGSIDARTGNPFFVITHYQDTHTVEGITATQALYIGDYQLAQARQLVRDGPSHVFLEALYSGEGVDTVVASWMEEVRQMFPDGLPDSPTEAQRRYAAERGAGMIYAALSDHPVRLHPTSTEDTESTAASIMDAYLSRARQLEAQANTAAQSGDTEGATVLRAEATQVRQRADVLIYRLRESVAQDQITRFQALNPEITSVALIYGNGHPSVSFATNVGGNYAQMVSIRQRLDPRFRTAMATTFNLFTFVPSTEIGNSFGIFDGAIR